MKDLTGKRLPTTKMSLLQEEKFRECALKHHYLALCLYYLTKSWEMRVMLMLEWTCCTVYDWEVLWWRFLVRDTICWGVRFISWKLGIHTCCRVWWCAGCSWVASCTRGFASPGNGLQGYQYLLRRRVSSDDKSIIINSVKKLLILIICRRCCYFVYLRNEKLKQC